MANSFYGSVALTGGGTGALDDINHNNLTDGDGAIVIDAVNNKAYMYTYDSSSSDAESSPDIIVPDSNAGDGRWILVKTQAVDATLRTAFAATTFGGFLDGLGVKYDTMFLPANAFTPTTTSGAEQTSVEYETNDIQKSYLAFDGASQEYADINLVMPPTWDRSTIKAKIYWAPASGASSGDGVVFGFQGVAVSDDDAIDTSLGTAQEVTDTATVGADGDLHVTDATAAITIGGTPALGDLIHFKLYRDPTDGSDDMAEDALVFGVLIEFASTNTVAAWS
jgi:hypothetical protein